MCTADEDLVARVMQITGAWPPAIVQRFFADTPMQLKWKAGGVCSEMPPLTAGGAPSKTCGCPLLHGTTIPCSNGQR